MALITPKIISPNSSFDADEISVLSFLYDRGGDVYNRIEIEIENNDELDGYKYGKYKLTDDKYSLILNNVTYKTKIITLPPNTLSNGHSFLIRVRVGDNNSWSNYSKYCVVKCYKKSEISFVNISENEVLTNIDYTFKSQYVIQKNNDFIISDTIRSYVYKLYHFDTDKNDYFLIDESQTCYASSVNDILSYTFTNLVGKYKLTIVGVTKNNVSYQKSIQFSTIETQDRICEDAPDIHIQNDDFVCVQTKIKQYIAYDKNGNPKYTSNSQIDLTDGNEVYYKVGVVDTLTSNYVLQIWVKNFQPDVEFLFLKNKDVELSLSIFDNRVNLCSSVIKNEEKVLTNNYMQKIKNIKKDSSGNEKITNDDTVHIIVKCVNNWDYDIKAQVVGGA